MITHKMKKFILVISIFLIFACSALKAQHPSIDTIFEKDSVTILITDSGLGGLSVVAEIEKNMRNSGHFEKINLIFANALFNETGGYNALSDRNEKVKIFDQALSGMDKKYKPDMIFIACNTLSTIYKETNFAKTSKVPIIGIVDIGTAEILQKLNQVSNSKVLIFGTETTIEEDSYRSRLVESGVENSRIISQACPQLQSYIENDPCGEDTEMLIMSYVDEAIAKSTSEYEEIFVSLNCTHFGYSGNIWTKAFDFLNLEPIAIINPNVQMAEIMSNEKYANRFLKTNIDVQVVSKVKISEESISAISTILKEQSIAASVALIHYQIVFDLF